MKRVNINKLDFVLVLNEKTSSIAKAHKAKENLVVVIGNETVVLREGKYIVHYLNGNYEILTEEEFNKKFILFDEKFGFFEFNDIYRSQVYVKNVLKHFIGYSVKTHYDYYILKLHFSDNTMELQYEDIRTLKNDIESFRKILTMVKKVIIGWDQ